MSMKDKVFLDTAFVIASAIESDAFHEKALELLKEIRARGIQMVTTHAIVLEIGNALAGPRYRRLAITALDSMETDDKVTIIPLTEELLEMGYKLYRSRMDKEWGLVDCVSFVTMKQLGITESLTADLHFKQAGFATLLR
jgi:predicted nucleic acid-binding protein